MWYSLSQVVMYLQTSAPRSNGAGAGPAAAVAGSGLSMQDDKDRARQLDEELIAEGLSHRQQSHNGASTSTSHDQPKSSSHKSARDDSHGRPSRQQDSPDRERHWDRDRKRQHRSTSRDRDGRRKRHRSRSPEHNRCDTHQKQSKIDVQPNATMSCSATVQLLIPISQSSQAARFSSVWPPLGGYSRHREGFY